MESNGTDIKSIGERIRKLREKIGLTQSDLAKKLNVKRETVAQWETGARDLKTGYIIDLADCLNVSCDEILRGVKPENISVYKDLGLTDVSINNLKEITKEGINANPLLEHKNFKDVLRYLNDLNNISLQRFYFNEVMYPICWEKDFYNNLSDLDSISLCKAEADIFEIPGSSRCDNNCNKCHYKNKERDYICNFIVNAFVKIISNYFPHPSIPKNDDMYVEKADLLRYRMTHILNGIINDIESDNSGKEKLYFSNNSCIFEILNNEKSDQERFSKSYEEGIKNDINYIVPELRTEAALVATRKRIEVIDKFLKEYNINLKRKEKSNAHHNPPQE